MSKNGYKHSSYKRTKIVITHKDFYEHPRWKLCRKIINGSNKKECLKCGSKENICVDHIKPKTKYPKLSFDVLNLQQLCSICNKEKYMTEIDYRSKEYIQNILDYTKKNNHTIKYIKTNLQIKRFLFTYPIKHIKPKNFNGCKPVIKVKTKAFKGKCKHIKHYKIKKNLNKSLASSGFKEPTMDVDKILALQNNLT